MLSNEETNELVSLAKNGDELAKEKLITVNSPLIKSVIKRYLNKGIEYDDLYQLGALGFVKAIKNYDSAYNVKFTTYAVPMIAGEIKRFLRDDGTVKISRSIKHLSIQIKNFIVEYNQEHNKNPTLDEISKKFNMDKTDIVFAMEANTTPLSLNDKFEDEESCTLMDKISDGFTVEKYIDKLTIRELIENLSAREKQVIIMRYYMDKTQSEIAKALGVSQVQVSRIENKVLKEMKENINI